MRENRRTTYRISEAARELGISAEWLRVGEKRGFFPARRDRNGNRYYTPKDMERLRDSPGDVSFRNSYTMMWEPYTQQWADLLRSEEWYR